MATADYDALYMLEFTDRTQYDAAIAFNAGSNSMYGVPPSQAASLFALPYPDPDAQATRLALGRVLLRLTWNIQAPASDIFFPLNTGIELDPTVPSTTVPGQSPYNAPPGPDGRFTWVLLIMFRGGAVATPTPVVPIPPRRWICGFELPQNGETGGATITGQLGLRVSRDASRTTEGFGLAGRDMNSGTGSIRVTIQNFGQPASNSSWERIYLRLRAAPVGGVAQIWRCFGGATSSGMRIDVTTAGVLDILRVNNSSVGASIATVGTLAIDSWVRVDILVNFRTASAQGRFRLFFDGQSILDELIPNDGVGLGLNQTHTSSLIGNPDNANGFGMEIDIDDWHNAEIPNVGGTEILDSRDWSTGTHCYAVGANALAPTSSVNWVGDWRLLLQKELQITISASYTPVTSSTSGARLGVLTQHPPNVLEQLGSAAMAVGMFGSRASVDGTLGYSVNGGAIVLASIAQNASPIWNTVLFNPTSPPVDPVPLTPIELYHEKGASAGASSIYALMASVQGVGVWGPEDDPEALFDQPMRRLGPHNAPYPASRWVDGITARVDAPVMVGAGIYVGNSTGQDLAFALQAHWLWIRPITGASGGTHWSSTLLASHNNFGASPVTPNVSGARNPADDDQSSQAHLAGAGTQVNVSPVAYQWVAFMDPGMRHLINGAFAHASTLASAVNALIDPAFTPDVVMLQTELAGSDSNNRMFYRGPGFAGSDSSNLGQTITANSVSMGLGTITSQTPVHINTNAQIAYSAFRATDPNACVTPAGVAVVVGSYVGNGSSPRVIPLALGGVFPLFVLVTPISGVGVSIFRDPSHAGLTSSNAATMAVVASTGIVGGAINQITVESGINANGVTYSYFAIPGSLLAWENGVFSVVAPCFVASPPYCDDCISTEAPPIPPEGCVDDWGTPRADGLPYVPLMPGDTQSELQ